MTDERTYFDDEPIEGWEFLDEEEVGPVPEGFTPISGADAFLDGLNHGMGDAVSISPMRRGNFTEEAAQFLDAVRGEAEQQAREMFSVPEIAPVTGRTLGKQGMVRLFGDTYITTEQCDYYIWLMKAGIVACVLLLAAGVIQKLFFL